MKPRKVEVTTEYGINTDSSIEIDNNFDILNPEDGRTLFTVTLNADMSLSVTAGDTCKFDGKILDSVLHIIPRVANVVDLVKPEYK